MCSFLWDLLSDLLLIGMWLWASSTTPMPWLSHGFLVPLWWISLSLMQLLLGILGCILLVIWIIMIFSLFLPLTSLVLPLTIFPGIFIDGFAILIKSSLLCPVPPPLLMMHASDALHCPSSYPSWWCFSGCSLGLGVCVSFISCGCWYPLSIFCALITLTIIISALSLLFILFGIAYMVFMMEW